MIKMLRESVEALCDLWHWLRGQEHCVLCWALTTNPEDEYGEYVCNSCIQNKAENAYERYCEDFHDGGSTRFKTLEQQMEEARKLK